MVRHGQISHGRVRSAERERSLVSFMLFVFIFILLILAAVSISSQIDAALRNVERAECEVWRARSVLDPEFYLVGWQADQCREVGVPMPGIPVRE